MKLKSTNAYEIMLQISKKLHENHKVFEFGKIVRKKSKETALYYKSSRKMNKSSHHHYVNPQRDEKFHKNSCKNNKFMIF